MGLENAFLQAQVAHARVRPKRNAFHYGVYYLCFSLADRLRFDAVRFMSLNRFNVFSFYDRDHGARQGVPVDQWIKSVLVEWDIPQADGDVVLLTMPRVLGHVFNPVSFWFCLDKKGGLRAVLAEVNNTFGDRHSYVLFHEDRRVIAADDILTSDKVFHVSPFMDVTGHYTFRFHYGEKNIGVWINHHDADGLMLTTSVTGKRQELTGRTLLASFFRYPLVTLKVIGLIHFQAVKLFLKNIRYRPRPVPPPNNISR